MASFKNTPPGIKNTLKKIFFRFCFYSGIVPLLYFLQRKKNKVINYHHILPGALTDNNLLFGYTHYLDNFKKQIHFLKDHFGFTTDFKDESGRVILTFDDGAYNNLKYALPVLQKAKAIGYFFVVNNKNSEPLWIDLWFAWLSYVPPGTYTVNGLKFELNTPEDRLNAHHKLWQQLIEQFSPEHFIRDMNGAYPFEKIKDQAGEKYEPRMRRMTNEEISRLKQAGQLIGCHSKTHPVFSLIDEQQLQDEIEPDAVYNTPGIAIPFGTKKEIGPAEIDLIARTGYGPILLNQEKSFHPKATGRINLPNSNDPYEWHFYLSGLKRILL